MSEVRECPLCGESMRMVERQTADQIPGTSDFKVKSTWEWVCPECDNFEEAEGPAPGNA
jgi:acetone carboxylase gamma subunit